MSIDGVASIAVLACRGCRHVPTCSSQLVPTFGRIASCRCKIFAYVRLSRHVPTYIRVPTLGHNFHRVGAKQYIRVSCASMCRRLPTFGLIVSCRHKMYTCACRRRVPTFVCIVSRRREMYTYGCRHVADFRLCTDILPHFIASAQNKYACRHVPTLYRHLATMYIVPVQNTYACRHVPT